MLEERRARGAPSLRNLKTGSEAWQTHYLSLDGEFQRACADIVQKLRAVVYGAGSEEAWQLLGGQQAEGNQALTLRCAEYHDVTPGGSLADPGAASVASLLAAVLTEIYLCNACSYQEILRRNGRG
eukprot:COSAG01_NODE_6138_length_3829_cov_4.557105_3_plen_126_part_00